jgi:hypothetical protein
MPLLDHFHPPIYPSRPWESFHSRWANSIADALQQILPPRYVSEVQIHLGSSVEADVAEFEQPAESAEVSPNGLGGVALQTWAPVAPPLTMAIAFPDEIEVQVRDMLEDARLVAVVELISPRNLDRHDARRGFAAKCAAYLQKGIGLIVADIVTARQANLHNELIRLLGADEEFLLPEDVYLYAVAYRPARRGEDNQIDLWPVPLTVGETLPLLPLALRGTRAVPVDLEKTYRDARERSRL